MTDDYSSGKGHPHKVDPTGRSDKFVEYNDEEHGNAIVMCSRRNTWCKNIEVKVKDYAEHLLKYHHTEIDPVQERLMKSSAMVKPSIRKSKYVWAPFPQEIPATIYVMQLEHMEREKRGEV